jgi:acyl-CoA synthetase (AMP-forming)/AMP-acid ligase II
VALSTSTLDRAPAIAFARDLARYGNRPALLTATVEISYAELAARVEDTATQLGTERRLVLLAADNSVDAVVTYLGALAGGHPVLLMPSASTADPDTLIATYRPDVVARPVDGRWHIEERHPTTTHDLHPDLALLLSTSGSTGSPKLVRLSRENLESNAQAIATYLGIRADDRAATTLPMAYCYGLSVINSHLLCGAGLILTDASVSDPRFWELFRARAGTSFAGVPYTFELLDRVGFESMALPHLRTVTQAGGRLDPERVARYADLGRRAGWRLFVMYGQTEATARMAYLPPELAETHPFAIGRPIPGGAFRLEPDGELVYSGPNVMLGYAETPADLALGPTVHELRTGDLARRGPDGIYEIVGRRSRFAKVLGLRVDPHRVEATLAEHGIAALCVGRDEELLVAAVGGDERRVRRLVTERCGLPARAVRVQVLTELPRLANGKPDYAAVHAPSVPAAEPTDLVGLYAAILDRADVTEDSSFVSLGGDSLSYVEMSIRLEQALGELPADWHTTPIRDLVPAPQPPAANRRRLISARLDTSVALRALAIVLVVGTHAQLFAISGGAHLLLGVAGFNLARFHLTEAARTDRVRSILASVRRIALASVAWIALVFVLTDDYALRHVLLLNYVIGPPGQHNHYWFIEAFVYVVLGFCALLAVPWIDRLERRFPFALPMGIATIGLLTRYDLIPGIAWRTPALVFWLVALGWAAARATTVARRAVVSVAVVATVPGFFGDPAREAVIVAGMLLLIWRPTLPSLRAVNRVAGLLAGASLYIYLTHWQVYPQLDQISGLLALIASLAVGIGFATVVRRTPRLLRHLRGRRSLMIAASDGHLSPSLPRERDK